jgi:hypothetical protein
MEKGMIEVDRVSKGLVLALLAGLMLLALSMASCDRHTDGPRQDFCKADADRSETMVGSSTSYSFGCGPHGEASRQSKLAWIVGN